MSSTTAGGRNVRGELSETKDHAWKSAQEAGRAMESATNASAAAMESTAKAALDTGGQLMNQAQMGGSKMMESTQQMAHAAGDTGRQALSGVSKIAGYWWESLMRGFKGMTNRAKAVMDASPLVRMFVYCFLGLSVIPLAIYTTYVSVTATGIFIAASIIALMIEGGLALAGGTILLPVLGLAVLGASAVVMGYMGIRVILFMMGKLTSAAGMGESTMSQVESSMDRMGGPGVEIKELTGTKYGYHKNRPTKEFIKSQVSAEAQGGGGLMESVGGGGRQTFQSGRTSQ